MSTPKRQPVDYAAQVAARRAAAAAASGSTGSSDEGAPTPPGGGVTISTNGEISGDVPSEHTQQQGQSAGGSAEQRKDSRPAIAEKPTAPSEATPRASEPTKTPAPQRRIGVSADTPIAKKKVDRQGIDLRPLDRERWQRFEMFCLTHRLRLGKKKGLSLYARAGLQLLDELIERDEAAAEALLRSIGEASTS